jgi:hypothetical protein
MFRVGAVGRVAPLLELGVTLRHVKHDGPKGKVYIYLEVAHTQFHPRSQFRNTRISMVQMKTSHVTLITPGRERLSGWGVFHAGGSYGGLPKTTGGTFGLMYFVMIGLY